MKNLIIYSSVTGNTKKIAEVCYNCSEEDWEIKNINENINIREYDKIVVGFWVDRGKPDKKSLELISQLKNKKTAFFATLGAYPDSNHAKKTIKRTNEFFEENNNIVLSSFICQGAVDPKLIKKMKTYPKDHPHGPSEERIRRWTEAAKHPNNEDLEKASNWFRGILNWS